MAARKVKARRAFAILAFIVALVASAASGVSGEPGLPDVALGWTLLFYVERAAAMVGLLGLAIVVLWRAGGGELPIRVANIEYEAKQTAAEASRAFAGQEIRIAKLEQVLGLEPDALVRRREGD